MTSAVTRMRSRTRVRKCADKKWGGKRNAIRIARTFGEKLIRKNLLSRKEFSGVRLRNSRIGLVGANLQRCMVPCYAVVAAESDRSAVPDPNAEPSKMSIRPTAMLTPKCSWSTSTPSNAAMAGLT
jgi:hypothetical protein